MELGRSTRQRCRATIRVGVLLACLLAASCRYHHVTGTYGGVPEGYYGVTRPAPAALETGQVGVQLIGIRQGAAGPIADVLVYGDDPEAVRSIASVGTGAGFSTPQSLLFAAVLPEHPSGSEHRAGQRGAPEPAARETEVRRFAPPRSWGMSMIPPKPADASAANYRAAMVAPIPFALNRRGRPVVRLNPEGWGRIGQRTGLRLRVHDAAVGLSAS